MLRAFAFPFKLNDQIKPEKPILDWLVSTFETSEKEAFTPFLHNIEKFRNILDFLAINKQILGDFSLGSTFELMVNQYLSKILILEFLKSPIFDKSPDIKITFKWNNSMNPKSNLLEYSDITYETISILYNDVLIYYYQGIYLINIPERETKLKGLAKLRNSLWLLNELVIRREKIEYSLSMDLDIRMLKVFQDYISGMILTTMAEMMKENKDDKAQQIAGVWMKSIKLFEEAKTMLENLEYEFSTVKLLKSLKSNVQFNLIYSNHNFLSIITATLNEKAKEDAAKGYMGFSVYYTEIMKQSLEIMMKKSENSLLEEAQRKFIQEEYKLIIKLLDERTKLNDRLYVDKEQPYEKIQELYDETATEIRLLEPKPLKELIELELKNISFSLGSFKALRSKLEKRISNSVGELDKEIYKLQIVKEGLYSRHDVEKIVVRSSEELPAPEIPKELMAKIIELNKNGGLDALEAQFSGILDMNKQANIFLKDIESKIFKEQNEDQSLSQKYGKDWDRFPSTQANIQLVANLQGLKNKIQFSASHDQKNAQFLENSKKWLKFFRGSSQDLCREFMPENKTALSQSILNTIQYIKNASERLKSYQEKILMERKGFEIFDFQNILILLFYFYNKEQEEEKIIQILFSEKAKDFDRIFDLITEQSRLLNEMTKTIYELNRLEQEYNNMETALAWSKALDKIKILRENLINAELFYKQILGHITDFKSQVEIYINKREEEKIKAIGILEYLEALKKKK